MGTINQFGGFTPKGDSTNFKNIGILCHFKREVSILFNEQNGLSLAIESRNDIEECIQDDGTYCTEHVVVKPTSCPFNVMVFAASVKTLLRFVPDKILRRKIFV